ncbi:MAG: glycosyltransferase [Chloroflexota bacterium]|nr:glycosyltransferase [Chloroflexota bacterium]
MRIALVAPLVSPIDDERIPPGGAQALLADLAAGLASRGHRVTLLAASGSRVRGVETIDLGLDPARFVPAVLGRAAERSDDAAQRLAFALIARWLAEHRGGWDVVHAHAYDAPAFDALRPLRPVIHTLHLAPLDPGVVTAAAAAVRAGAVLAAVSWANARAWTAAGVRTDLVLPNGVDVGAIPYSATGGPDLLFAGRISPEKGPATAIRAARRAGREIVLAGPVYDRAHFVSAVEPLLAGDARYAGALARPDLYRLMGVSAALLLPVRWDEPFGLVAVEAQAAGTPVVTFARGGLVELVADGRTGFLVETDDEDAFVAAIRRIGGIDRAACRRNAERWTIARMLDAHERLYARLARGA